MSNGQTYKNYYRAYYYKNREKILERTRAYRKKYNHEYYLKKKLERQNKINNDQGIKKIEEAQINKLSITPINL